LQLNTFTNRRWMHLGYRLVCANAHPQGYSEKKPQDALCIHVCSTHTCLEHTCRVHAHSHKIISVRPEELTKDCVGLYSVGTNPGSTSDTHMFLSYKDHTPRLGYRVSRVSTSRLVYGCVNLVTSHMLLS
jgi:hypothetical protein